MLLVIGGHENKGESTEKKAKEKLDPKPFEILRAFIKLTGKENAIIEVITTASTVGDESYHDYQKAFTGLGVKQVGHIHHANREEALNTEAIERINKADGVFFSGGNQLKLTSVYGGTDFLFKLKQRYIYDNLIIGGTSAGAMAFSTPMIFAGNKTVQQIAGEVKITTGLEFLKDICIDTHFVDRGRFVRMAQVIASNPTCVGMGIEEDTALIIRNGIDVEVIGNGVVIVIEGFRITDSNILNFGADERIYIHDLNVKILSEKSKYTIPQNSPLHL